MTNPKRHAVRAILAVVAAMAGFGAGGLHGARAGTVVYDFTVIATDGPLNGSVSPGVFTYAISSIPPGGGTNSSTGLLTALAFTWNGTTFDRTTANTGALEFDAAGNLAYFLFGSDCGAGACNIGQGGNDWVVSGGTFQYVYPGTNEYFRGIVSYAQVPEPGSLVLLAGGLLLLVAGGASRWRAMRPAASVAG